MLFAMLHLFLVRPVPGMSGPTALQLASSVHAVTCILTSVRLRTKCGIVVVSVLPMHRRHTIHTLT